MTDSKTLKLLLVEDNLDDEQLLCEALIEIEEQRLWCNWRNASVMQVDRLMDALDCLRAENFDAVLLNLSLPDSPSLLDSLLEVTACAPGLPVVVLADEDDEHLANRLLREGAEDVFLKSELECLPLARAVRYAIERRRGAATLTAASIVDPLTRTLTKSGFLDVAEYYSRLAFDSHVDLHLAHLDIRELSASQHSESRELLLIRAGEVLREVFDGPALIGRLEGCRFGLIVPSLAGDTVEDLLRATAARIEEAWIPMQASISFSVAELNPQDSIADLLGRGELPGGERLKTAMLAD